MDDRSNNDGAELETSAADTLKTAATDVKQVVHDTMSNIKTAAQEQSVAIKERTLAAIGDAQGRAADQARTAAATLRDAANGVGGELPWMGTALNKTADGLDHLTSAFAKGDINDALDAVKAFSKRQPALFLGLSVAAGFAIARIGKTAIEAVQPAADSAEANGADTSAVGA